VAVAVRRVPVVALRVAGRGRILLARLARGILMIVSVRVPVALMSRRRAVVMSVPRSGRGVAVVVVVAMAALISRAAVVAVVAVV
jgi:hypothetical protein